MWDAEFFRHLRYHRRHNTDSIFGIFDPRVRVSEDRDASILSLGVAWTHGHNPAYVNTPSVHYRRHLQSITGETPREEARRDHEIITRKYMGPNLTAYSMLRGYATGYKILTRQLPKEWRTPFMPFKRKVLAAEKRLKIWAKSSFF